MLKVQESLCKKLSIHTNAKSEQFKNEHVYQLFPNSGLARAKYNFIRKGGSSSDNLIFHQH